MSAVKKIGPIRLEPGTHKRGRLAVALYPDGRQAYIPIEVFCGKKTGKILALVTGAHGDEINGPEAVSRALSILDIKKMSGTVVVLPLMNPWGFTDRLRVIPIDQRDLNRSFPGHKHGSFSYQVAHTIMHEVIHHVDAVVDVHDAGTRMIGIPHTRVHLTPERDPSRDLGLAFGSDIVLLRKAQPGMLAKEARDLFGTTVVTIEVGGAMQVDEDFQRLAVVGIGNMLRHIGILSGKLHVPAQQQLLEKRKGSLAELTGVQTTWARLGDVVLRNEPLYRIQNPNTGQVITHTAKYCGVVLSKNILARVDRGQEAISILKFRSCNDSALATGRLIRNRAGTRLLVVRPGVRFIHRFHSGMV